MKESVKAILQDRLPEFLREFGLLWLVFSILDRLVADKLTASWLSTNITVGIASWVAGIYIESRKS